MIPNVLTKTSTSKSGKKVVHLAWIRLLSWFGLYTTDIREEG